jgi:hypothetical protein
MRITLGLCVMLATAARAAYAYQGPSYDVRSQPVAIDGAELGSSTYSSPAGPQSGVFTGTTTPSYHYFTPTYYTSNAGITYVTPPQTFYMSQRFYAPIPRDWPLGMVQRRYSTYATTTPGYYPTAGYETTPRYDTGSGYVSRTYRPMTYYNPTTTTVLPGTAATQVYTPPMYAIPTATVRGSGRGNSRENPVIKGNVP